MEQIRKPYQGILNIIRFNWHFYVLALGLIMIMFFTANYLEESFRIFNYALCSLVLGSTVISLLASFYVYDLSGIYNLKWIEQNNKESLVVNINAGFDETSHLISDKFKNAELVVLDFYNPLKHTEVSIRRARKAYPPFPKTKVTETAELKLADNSVDKIFVIFSAHEIRNEIERETFFKELNRVIKPTGEIYVTEHLRDLSNFLVYNVGFFHFYSEESWHRIFNKANLEIKQEIKLTPFISNFILNKNGNTL